MTHAEAGQTVALALKRVRRAAVRKGMVIVHKIDAPPRAVKRFEGQVLILYHNTTMQVNYQAMLHCGVCVFCRLYLRRFPIDASAIAVH